MRDDMASVYRERIADSRLKAITDYVRGWFFGVRGTSHEEAKSIRVLYKGLPTLDDLMNMFERLTGRKPDEVDRPGLEAKWRKIKRRRIGWTRKRKRAGHDTRRQGLAGHP